MGFFERFPYTNIHELNLDWLLNAMKELSAEFKSFADTNKINYADPFAWDITRSYAAMTLVADPTTYQVYLSRVPVPAGVELNNNDYWLRVGDMSAYGQQIDSLHDGQVNLGLQLDALRETTADRLDALEALEPEIKYPARAFSECYAVCFGDSNTMPSPPTGYGNAFNRICDYLQPKAYKSYGISGATIQNGIGTYPVVSAQIEGANDYPAAEVGFVFFMAGINDYHYGTYDASAFGSAVRSTVQAIHAKFPNALIVSAMDCGHELPNGRMLLYVEAMKRNSVAVGSGVKTAFVPLVDFATQDSLWYNQNHYSSTGAIAIACRVINTVFGAGHGYTPAPKYTEDNYTNTNLGLNNAYNFRVQTITTIDPWTLVRRDRTHLLTLTDFNLGGVTGGSSAAAIVRVPGCWVPGMRRIAAQGGYMPAYMLRSTGSYINTVSLANITPNSINATEEPQIEIRLPYTADETWTNARGVIDFESIITIADTAES